MELGLVNPFIFFSNFSYQFCFTELEILYYQKNIIFIYLFNYLHNENLRQIIMKLRKQIYKLLNYGNNSRIK
jgi:hypothetical protein